MSKPASSNRDHLKDRVALVLGAADSIGQRIAVDLAEAGATVVVADEGTTNLLETMLQLEAIGGMHTLRAVDLSQEDEQQALVEFVFERFSRLDLLVHGASFRSPIAHGIAEMSREMGEDIIRGNLIDPLFFTQRVTQEMRQRHIPGSVIFLTSIFGQVPALDPASSSSNAALSMLVRDLALELAEFGIRVNAVAHGRVSAKSDGPAADQLIPLGYRITPEDIAAAVCFLVSDKARFITGITLPVDGGQSLLSEAYLRSRRLLRS